MGQRQNSTSTLQIQRAMFLPMLCSRPSIKNVTVPTKPQSLPLQDQDDDEDNKEDPLSPKISCIGQVKRNNKITNFPLTITTTTTRHHNNNHYFKLKRLFSGKSLTLSLALSNPKPTNTNTHTPRTRTRTRRRISEESAKNNNKGSDAVDVVDMDPPLPVVKKKLEEGDKKAAENLWKRRSGGLELRSLQIREIQNRTCHQMQLVTTV